MIFYTSDTHFFHKNIIQYCPDSRGHFNTIEEMNTSIVTAWNNKVTNNDIIYHLGDFIFSKSNDQFMLDQLNCKKMYLIPGNHDTQFSKINHHKLIILPAYYELKIDHNLIVLCHYPFKIWNRSHYGSYHFHGHSHGTLTRYHNHVLDVGIDARPDNDLTPWEHAELLTYLKEVPYE